MDIEIKTMEGPLAVVVLGGDMDLYCAGHVRDCAKEHWDKRKDALIIDMARLDYIDSSGIGTIIKLFAEARERGLGFYLAAVPPNIYKVMELTKLIGFLPICDTVPEAVGKLHNSRNQQRTGVDERGPLLINGQHRLFNTKGMKQKEFNIDFGRIRYLSHLISQQAPPEIREFNLLEQQISEIVKNAVRHGNLNDIRKKVRVWYFFDTGHARLIIQDEGTGFAKLEEWNEFFRKRMECFEQQDYEGMAGYISYRTEESTDDDGGNALFAAVEYWDEGVVFNETRNVVAVGKTFRQGKR
jgi:serine/threonine-protein kinase RsbW